FHRHGHKVSFTTIAAAYLAKQSRLPWPGQPERIEVVALLAAIDSIFWDQYGCLSSRVHFIEESPTGYSAQEYGQVLVRQIRLISQFLPRGARPLHGLHNRFEKYAALAGSNQVQICSNYEDDFLVVIDRRPWTAAIFNATVNDCQERTIVVRPVLDIAEVPQRYLAWVPPANLQTMSVAIDGPEHPTWSTRFEEFATAVGRCGVTALRAVGRSPFPQLAYSWDGYLPLDLAFERPPGWFTSVEFESNFVEISQTYQMYIERQN
ncbi:MAG: hypothetical protein JW862_08470, partial [Anaerolineales bacterium]|nr:hypothetical protein [Anaerolineales bacterium]